MKIDHEKFMFVFDYLRGLGFDSETILEAVCDKRIKRSYKVITKNPGIGKYEFVKKARIKYDEEEVELLDFLRRLRMHCYHIEEALDEDNYERTLEIYKTRPDISREEFLAVMQFTDKYKEYFVVPDEE